MDLAYLDNNATTQPTPEVCAAVMEAHEQLWANPSSVHRFGQLVRQRVELARQSVAQLIGCAPNELVFTSGGTESNTLAIEGVLGGAPAASSPKPDSAAAWGCTLISTKIEHAAVREPAEAREKRGGRVVWLPMQAGGVVAARDVEAALDAALNAVGVPDASLAEPRSASAWGAAVVVSLQWANNETGVIQPVREVALVVEAARQRLRGEGRRVTLLFHVDATQAVGKLPVDVKTAGIDLMTFAGHKLHGPKGVGCLFIKRGVRLTPVQRGGPQERELRGGTENVPAILGLGIAARQAVSFLQDADAIAALAAMRDALESRLTSKLGQVVVNGQGRERLWNTTNLGFTGLEAEAILLGLSERGVCASAGAACSSGSLEPSPVLLAMGVPEAVAHGSVRLSLSRFTTRAEIDRAAEALESVVARLRKVMPMGGA